MSLLSAPDAQDQNSSSTNKESRRTSRTRVIRACKSCYTRKVKCNRASPCKRCCRRGTECVYYGIEPATEPRSLPNLENLPSAGYKKLHGTHGELEGLCRGRSVIPIDPQRGHGTEAFLSKELHRLSLSYVTNVHTLHPLFDNPQEMCDEFINDLQMMKGIIPNPRNACVLLFFALGSLQSTTNSIGSSSPLPGSVYYSYAKDMFKYKLGERDILVMQALTLAALWTNRNGMLQDSIVCYYVKV